jgi:hypothetical protein
LKAAQLGYKSPQHKFDEAVANTRRMFEVIKGIEHVTQVNLAKKKLN